MKRYPKFRNPLWYVCGSCKHRWFTELISKDLPDIQCPKCKKLFESNYITGFGSAPTMYLRKQVKPKEAQHA